MRKASDKLCEEYGLNVLKQEEKYDKYATSSLYNMDLENKDIRAVFLIFFYKYFLLSNYFQIVFQF